MKLSTNPTRVQGVSVAMEIQDVPKRLRCHGHGRDGLLKAGNCASKNVLVAA